MNETIVIIESIPSVVEVQGHAVHVPVTQVEVLTVGIQGATGATGAAGPNLVNGSTATSLTGYLKGNGSVVSAQATPIPVADGGTGTATPSLVAGTNVTITGTWPNQTVNSTGGGGTPGGSNTNIQVNVSGAFSGSQNLKYYLDGVDSTYYVSIGGNAGGFDTAGGIALYDSVNSTYGRFIYADSAYTFYNDDFSAAGIFAGQGYFATSLQSAGLTSTVGLDSIATYSGSLRSQFFVAIGSLPTRNNASFTIGHTFIPADFISVSELGRKYFAGNTQNHAIGIWEKLTGTLVASGTVLAASGSDVNGFKYVSITPVTLSPLKEYIIAAQENLSGDTWADAWNSIDYFDQYIKRTGFAYVGSTSLTLPTTFASGTSIYNTCTFKFTPEAQSQVTASYNGSKFLGLLSRSDGSATLTTSNLDKLITILSPVSIGGTALSSAYNFGSFGDAYFASTTPITTENNGPADGGARAVFGASSGISKNGVFMRGGYLILEAGSGSGQTILAGYDNQANNFNVGTIIAAKFAVQADSASKKVAVFRGAASQSANIIEAQNSAGLALMSVDKNGGIVPASMTDATAVNGTLYYSTTASKLVYKDSGGTVNALY